MSKENFKGFVRKHPELVTHVNNNTMSWQKFYDMYDLYGEDNSVWDTYFKKAQTTVSVPNKTESVKELFNMIKNVDLNSVQKGISGMQKAIGLIQELGIGSATNTNSNVDNYEPRPMYKNFED